MKKYLITYDNTTVIAITEAPTGGMIVSGTKFLIETLENAREMLLAINIDVAVIDNYQGY